MTFVLQLLLALLRCMQGNAGLASQAGVNVLNEKKVVLALRLRDEVVEAALWRNEERLKTILPALVRRLLSSTRHQFVRPSLSFARQHSLAAGHSC